MFARIASISWVRWGRSSLVLALCGLPLYASCTKSEDTEPFIPADEGGIQPGGGGDLLTEEDVCSRLLDALEGAYDRLGCDAPKLPSCPDFVRPAGGSGCYEYTEGSVAACEKGYGDATSCRKLSPCFIDSVPNTELPTCELTDDGSGGAAAGGASTGGAAAGGETSGMGGVGAEGGMGPLPSAGSPGEGGAGQGGAGGAG
jgi:hypothetical protein